MGRMREMVAIRGRYGAELHMAAWVGTAKTLVALKDRWRGSEVTVFSVSVIGDSMGRGGPLRRIPRNSTALERFILACF